MHKGAQSMRIVMTGATGFIGKALCQSLVQDGHEIIAFTRSPAKAHKVLGEQVVSASRTNAAQKGGHHWPMVPGQ